MNCPECQAETIVADSRVSSRGNSVRRRRECPGCAHRFTTYEMEHGETKRDEELAQAIQGVLDEWRGKG